MAPRDWAAGTYHRVSTPHLDWADAILDRLPLRGDETVLDAGCGSGRVTAKLVERLPRGRVIAVDGAPSMVAEARRNLPEEVEILEQDLLALALPAPVDAVFSSAVFHWIEDHPRLFARLAAALRPGGRLVAQCGGRGERRRLPRPRRRGRAPGALRGAPPRVRAALDLRLTRGDRGAPAGRRVLPGPRLARALARRPARARRLPPRDMPRRPPRCAPRRSPRRLRPRRPRRPRRPARARLRAAEHRRGARLTRPTA